LEWIPSLQSIQEAPTFATSLLLQPNGVPPFGANGLAFNPAGTTLFVANTANDTVVQIPVSNPTNASVFVHSINGADGLIIEEDDNLWVAANQADEIVVVNPSGRAIAKLGDFSGLDPRAHRTGCSSRRACFSAGDFSTSPTSPWI
jgi:DNA-binding beta-propeller fold protein YncE